MRNFMPVAFAIMIIIPCCKKEKKGLPAVSTTIVSNITASSFSTGGNITDDGNQGITKRGVCWADHADPTVADSITDNGSGSGSFTSNINGLNANTNYYLRAYASNASGTAYGNEIMVTTAKGLATISTTAISDIKPLSAKSGGNIANDGGASVTERGVVYSISTNPTTASSKIVSGTGTGNFTATLSPLASQQTYYVRAYAINSYGTAYGKQVQFNASSANTITDVDGNVYPYVTLCDGKSWMAANLKTTKYRNGEAITNGSTGFTWAWATVTPGAYTFPNGDVSKKDSFGLLYNVFAVTDSKGVCPTGWHVPTDAEWQALEVCEGMDPGDAASNGTRGVIGAKFLEGGSTGLNMRKAGYFYFSTNPGAYSGYGNVGFGAIWTSSTSVVGPNYLRMRIFNPANDPAPILRQSGSEMANSVRCVKD